MTCVSPLVFSDMKFFVDVLELQQVSEFFPVQLHIRDSHSGVQALVVLLFFLEESEHLLHHTINNPAIFI